MIETLRLSTLYTALGAAYGSKGQGWNVDLLKVSTKLFDSSRKLQNYQIPQNDFSYFMKWMKYYNPFSVTDVLLK